MYRYKFHIILLCGAFILQACHKRSENGVTPIVETPNTTTNNEYVNNWIHQQMSVYYLWADQLPKKITSDQSPATYFESLLYKKNDVEGDRFSWIQENYTELLGSLSGVSSLDMGFESYFYISPAGEIFGQVQYVKPNTPAAKQNLKRGDCYSQVDGISLTEDNIEQLIYNSKTSSTFTFIDLATNNTQKVQINKVANYEEYPILLDTVYTINNEKIAYLVYNFFAADNGDQSMRYDLDLNTVFGKFKQSNASELILDLRYNSGGSVLSAVYLASMAVRNLNTKNVFNLMKLNAALEAEYIQEYGTESLKDYFQTAITIGRKTIPLSNTGTQRVYVLTGSRTASASEMIINGLKPYMDVVVIGDQTVGKNMGSISLYEENNPNNTWGMQPLVLKYFNAEGKADFANGFVPDIQDKDNSLSKKELGDTQEVLLNLALRHINAAVVPTRTQVSGNQLIGTSMSRKAWNNTMYRDFIRK